MATVCWLLLFLAMMVDMVKADHETDPPSIDRSHDPSTALKPIRSDNMQEAVSLATITTIA